MTHSDGRIVHLELLAGQLQTALAAVQARQSAAEQLIRQLSAGGGSAGGSIGSYWCRGTFAAASGSWPAITPTAITADVYQDLGGTLTLAKSGATVRWWYLDASGTNKLTPVVPNGDGSYDAITASCTGV